MQYNENKNKIKQLLIKNKDSFGVEGNIFKGSGDTLLNTDKYYGISYKFEMKKDVDHVLDENRTLQSMYNDKISNVLLTKPGERLFDNQFGSLLQNYLFGDDNNTDKQKNHVKNVINQFIPELTIDNVDIEFVQDEEQSNKYKIKVIYTIPILGQQTMLELYQ